LTSQAGFVARLHICASSSRIAHPLANSKALKRRYDDCEINFALVWWVNDEDLLMVRPSRRKMRSEEE
jgi:hypothetical protein